MSKYKDAMEKISADEKLKAETKNMLMRQSANGHTPHSRQTPKRRFGAGQKALAACVALMLVCIVVAGSVAGMFSDNLNSYTSSRSNIINEIKSRKDKNGYNGGGGDGATLESSDSSAPTPGAESGTSGSGDYAKTNTQVEGVDEGDIIKVDGGFIYKLSSAGLSIVNVKNEMFVSCEKGFDKFVPVEMFIFNDRLIVIGGVYETFNYYGNREIGHAVDCIYIFYQNTKIIIYDMNADRTELTLKKERTVSGSFLTSRLIDNKLVFAVNYSFYLNDENTYFPKIDSQEIDAKDIYLYPTERYTNYVIIASVNVDNLEMKYFAHLGLFENYYYSTTFYISKDYWYFFYADYSGINYNLLTGYSGIERTKIFKIDLKTLKHTASGVIDGTVSDRYWADEYQGNLRVVSWVSGWWSTASSSSYAEVTVLDKNLNQLGKITGIAKGERVYSARFNEKEGSLVTFRQIDPLFKLDLSNPRRPKISDGLKEEGFSTYLQYLGNDILLGLGRDATSSGQQLGVKVSIYDNSGANAVNVGTIVLGNGSSYSYAEALYNPKAILNDPAKNMFSFAVSITVYNYYSTSWNYHVEEGLAVFEYDLSKDKPELVFRGILSNTGKDASYTNWYDYYDAYHSYITRGARIGNKIYTISDRYITSYDVNSLELVQQLEIASFKSVRELYGY